MKIYTLTKRGLLILFSCVLLGATALTVLISTTTKAVETAAEPRDIPIYCVETDKKQVAISFDAAWGNEQTETLLKILSDKNVKSTFFLVGDWADKYPDSVKAIANAGHDVGNHSDTHPYMTQLSSEDKTKELRNCNEKIKELTGVAPTLFRPPYGDYDNAVVNAVKSENMYCVQWDVDSLDWKDPTPRQMIERITSKIAPGSIILMHNGAKNTPEALPLIIDAVREMGYEFVPISQLLPKGEYTTDHEGRMHIKADSQ
ncbi:MAG: polysaccharide deacetylase family protein [Eubacteriales bacterium]|nr:polysaccharide deacetylase family protein [Eubacteriales bacterium]